MARIQATCDLSVCISLARDIVRLNRTAPPRAVAQTWKLDGSKNVADFSAF